jgi:hypothetical protein
MKTKRKNKIKSKVKSKRKSKVKSKKSKYDIYKLLILNYTKD